MEGFEDSWESSKSETLKYVPSTNFENVFLELVQGKNFSDSYSVFWDVIKNGVVEAYKFDEEFENEAIENRKTVNKELSDIWDFVSRTHGFDNYKSDSTFDAEYGDLEFEIVFSHCSRCVKGPKYRMCQVLEDVFDQIVPENSCKSSAGVPKNSAANPKKKKEASQKLKTLLELRKKRLKLMDDNILSIRIDNEFAVTYECKHCGQRSKRKRKLFISHILPTHLKPKKKTEKKGRRKNKIKVLVKSEVKKRYICSNFYCAKKFTSRYARKRHIISVHRKTLSFQCDLCPKVCRDRYNLLRHKKQKHKEATSFKCVVCSYRSKKRFNLQRHIETNHNEAGILENFGYIQCDVCRKSFLYVHSLMKHKEIHQAISIGFNCPICNNKKSENHQCKFDCTKCDSTFSSKTDMRKHERIHLKVESVIHATSTIRDHEKLKSQLLALEFK